MMIYRKTSRAVDWRAVLWFAIGVFVTLCSATYTHFDAAGACAKPEAAHASAFALASQPAMQPVTQPSAQPGRAPGSTTQLATESNSTAVAASSARLPAQDTQETKTSNDAPRALTHGIAVDVSLSVNGDAGRQEMAPVDAAPPSVQVPPPDAASVIASAHSPADAELENKLRSQPDNTAARLRYAADSVLLPHEKP
ncbi:hypothetical protein BH11PSE9_BH11PSE9_00170 [soil metagenome]